MGRPPGLGVVLVGGRRDSELYVTRKKEACERVGIKTSINHLPVSIQQNEVETIVKRLSSDPSVDGVLIQLPLPPHLNEEQLVDCVHPDKDVDGFHPLNMGKTLMRGRRATLVPCTALGVLRLLKDSSVALRGKNVVILGDSNIVGMPLAMLFRDHGAATVMVVHRTSYRDLFEDASSEVRATQRADAGACHPRLPGPLSGHGVGLLRHHHQAPYELTYSSNLRDAYGRHSSFKAQSNQDLPAITRTADILVVAVGYPELVKGDWVKPGAVVIDVGINVVEGGKGEATEDHHLHVLGDVDAASVGWVASAMTPVPGGVGPMTVAALLYNTVEGCRRSVE